MKSPLTGKEMLLLNKPSVLTYRGKDYKVTHHYYLCEDTNEEFTTTSLDTINMEELYNQLDK
jgi:hypothetical protein